MSDSKGLDYRQAGVDIDAGNELVKRVGPLSPLRLVALKCWAASVVLAR